MEIILVVGLGIVVAVAGWATGVVLGVYSDRAWSKWRGK
jgi:hypothetical protein